VSKAVCSLHTLHKVMHDEKLCLSVLTFHLLVPSVNFSTGRL
jgi:hypothetical protein